MGLRGKDPRDSYGTGDITDCAGNMGRLLLTTGVGEYADRSEKTCFNAGPGAIRSDGRGLQCFSSPNQGIADRRSNHNLFQRGSARMSCRPPPGSACCTGQVHRIFPTTSPASGWRTVGAGSSRPSSARAESISPSGTLPVG